MLEHKDHKMMDHTKMDHKKMDHTKHEKHDMGSHAHHIEVFKRKFWISLILTIPILLLFRCKRKRIKKST